MYGMAGFYDDFASDYHLLFEDWEASMARQEPLAGRSRPSMYDNAFSSSTYVAALKTSALPAFLTLGHGVAASNLAVLCADQSARQFSKT